MYQGLYAKLTGQGCGKRTKKIWRLRLTKAVCVRRTQSAAKFKRLNFYLQFASHIDSLRDVGGKAKNKRRSGCPVNVCLEVFGDRWSLLIVRDLMVRGYRTFGEFEKSGEGIASNMLADRLQRLEVAGIIESEVEASDGRKINYRLTQKGIDLAPVLLELLIWGAHHEPVDATCSLILKMEKNREQILAEVVRRWRERDLTPLIPRFDASTARQLGQSKKQG